jgi:hypothetical protein
MAIRKALLVGINAYRTAPLRGCINDVVQMKDLLQRYFGFPDEGIRTVLDEEATSAGIKAGLKWLAQGGDDPDAVRVFHYAGHGAFVVDENGDEPDGRDETLVPYDYKSAGMLTDDALKVLYDRFPASGNLTLVMDACHSGTNNRDIQEDIVYRFLPLPLDEREAIFAAAAAAADKFAREQQDYAVSEMMKMRGEDLTEDELRDRYLNLIQSFQKSRFGDIRAREANVLLAGCQPDQKSADARIEGDYHGAFTYNLAGAIAQADGQITYRQVAE